jgi:hypothetical protein
MSPGGEWVVCRKQLGNRESYKISLWNTRTEETVVLPHQYWPFEWSQDGGIIAFIEEMNEGEENDSDEKLSSRLILYEPDTRKTDSVSLEHLSESAGIHSWSPSGKFLLLASKNRLYCLSLGTGHIKEIDALCDNWRYVYWIKDDRLLWAVDNRLIVTERNGANPKEIFRVQDDGFYFNGEGKS